MSEAVVRKPLDRRAADWRSRLERWFHRHRPRIAVTAAFAIACLLGVIAASMGLANIGGGAP